MDWIGFARYFIYCFPVLPGSCSSCGEGDLVLLLRVCDGAFMSFGASGDVTTSVLGNLLDSRTHLQLCD